ncbi:MAG: acetolactate synthase small subunit [Chloroflexota bacterium]
MAATKHTIIAVVEDKPGVLNRMASLFRRRGFNIDSIAVGPTDLPHLSRMTIVLEGAASVVEQVRKQLDKVVDVVKVVDLGGENVVTRELALIKVKATSATRSEIIELVDIFRAGIVDVAADSVTVEVTGDEEKIGSLLGLLRGFGIKEVARTGRVAIARGNSGMVIREEKTGHGPKQVAA